jgi:hypothetical protein
MRTFYSLLAQTSVEGTYSSILRIEWENVKDM